jgi:hypothetical protein
MKERVTFQITLLPKNKTSWFFREIRHKVLKFCLWGCWGRVGGGCITNYVEIWLGMLTTVVTLQTWEQKKLLPTAPFVDHGELVSNGSLGNTLVGVTSHHHSHPHILANASNLIIFHSMCRRGVHQTMVVQCLTCILRSQTCHWNMTRFSVGKGFLFRPFHSSPVMPLRLFA